MRSAALLLVVAASACRCGPDPLETPRAALRVDPTEVRLNSVPVAQDTRIVVQMFNPGQVTLEDVTATLEDANPAFKIIEPVPVEVFRGQVDELVLIVRPLVPSTITATLVIQAHEDARPSRAEIPITVEAIDAGLPDICDFPESIAFDRIGRNDVARSPLQLCNCGVRDLLLDNTSVECVTEGDESIRITTPVPPGQDVAPTECLTLDVAFTPTDTELHECDVVVDSNDPDETQLRIPAAGQAAECPTACLQFVDDIDEIEPFDTVRLDGRCSTPASPDAQIEGYDWTLDIRPVGSTAVLSQSGVGDAAEIPVDIAGEYCVSLEVADVTGVRSCEPASACFNVVPTEDLHIQLVWDHPDADLDLHVVQGGGLPFRHETDCYFSNRAPPNAGDESFWSDNPDENPTLDVDDNEGYGPENTNIVHPAPLSEWKILVHYWNAQTDEDPRTTATLRVFVYGQQVMELNRVFEQDEQLWDAVLLAWPATEGDPASLSQVNLVSPFPRPF